MTGWDTCKYPRIFELLTEQNKTAADMARGIGVSKGNITTWKSGASAPSNAALVAIANYLNTTVKYITGETDIKEKPSANGELDELDNEIIRVFSSLSDEKKKAALEYLAFLKQQENGDN